MLAKFNKAGNTKIGKIWSFSTLMGDELVHIDYNGFVADVMGTCGKHCEGCKKNCYVKHSYRYPSVKYGHAWNTIAIRDDVESAFVDLHGQINRARNKPNAVRIHVSGEFESCAELYMWDKLANRFPNITFYVYSKAYDIMDEYIANHGINDNLIINVSIWHEYGIEFFKKYEHMNNIRAFVYDDGFDYNKFGILKDSKCPAYDSNGKTVEGVTCEKCGLCMGKRDKKVTFCHAH